MGRPSRVRNGRGLARRLLFVIAAMPLLPRSHELSMLEQRRLSGAAGVLMKRGWAELTAAAGCFRRTAAQSHGDLLFENGFHFSRAAE